MRCERWWRPGKIDAVITMTLPSACGTAGSNSGGTVCPPVITYISDEQARAAGEIKALPRDSAIAAMMADYHALRR